MARPGPFSVRGGGTPNLLYFTCGRSVDGRPFVQGARLKDLEAGFAEVEQRVKALLRDNAGLRERVARLERELSQARAESEDIQDVRGKRIHIRERIEKVLRTLEAIDGKDQ